MARPPDLYTLLEQPHYLLHRIDPASGTLTYVPTGRTQLAAAAFIDGRTPFATGPALVIAIDDALAAHHALAPAPNRIIFHVGFCGSTLLTRLLENPGAIFTYREPNALADLANWYAVLASTGATDPRMSALLDLTLAKLRAPWTNGEACVVKPSNWANNLLPLLADRTDLCALFVTMDVRAFVTAVFRGGRDRIRFAARALVHLATATPDFAPIITAATADSVSPFEKVARLAALLHKVQTNMFTAPQLDFAVISTDPIAASEIARTALSLPGHANSSYTDAVLVRNSKAPDRAFSAVDHAQADNEVRALYGVAIDAGLAWAVRQVR